MNDAGQAYIGWRLLRADPPASHSTCIAARRGASGQGGCRPDDGEHQSCRYLCTDGQGEQLVCPRGWSASRATAVGDGDRLPANSPPNRVRSIQTAWRLPFQSRRHLRSRRRRRVRLRHQAARAGTVSIRAPSAQSPDTYKLEAYNGKTGAFLWRYDLGWNMNMGVWWTPFITGDFDGDGKAEVALEDGAVRGDARGSLDRRGRIRA